MSACVGVRARERDCTCVRDQRARRGGVLLMRQHAGAATRKSFSLSLSLSLSPSLPPSLSLHPHPPRAFICAVRGRQRAGADALRLGLRQRLQGPHAGLLHPGEAKQSAATRQETRGEQGGALASE